jgi:hypothetical protein
MTIPTPGAAPVATIECKFCTVPVEGGGDVCGFCADYTPPATIAERLDGTVNMVDLLRRDVNEILRDLPADAPLMSVVDVVTALGHLRRAAVALDRATDALEADARAVTR